MVRIIIFFLLFFCAVNSFAQNDSLLSSIKGERLQADVYALAHDSMGGRVTGTIFEKKAADYIVKEFIQIGLQFGNNDSSFFSPFRKKFSKKRVIEGNNIIGFLPGDSTDTSFVIYCAHYDHINKGNRSDKNQDAIYNGANDNASGVSAILEIARYYTANRSNKSNILFIAFSGEEEGLLGSQHLAKNIDLKKIKAVFNIDMVGKLMNDDSYSILAVFHNRNNFLKNLNLALPFGEQNFFTPDTFGDEDLENRTDGANFKKVKYAVSFTSYVPDDPTYHHPKDEPSTLNYDYMEKVVKNIIIATAQFVQ